MKIGIIGNGFVGNAQARTWVEHVDEVRIYDLVPERRTHSLEAVMECDFVFVCVPTPMKSPDDPTPDLATIDAVLAGLDDRPHAEEGPIVVIKSTVPVGYTRRSQERWPSLTLVHSPEFLTARCAVIDAHMPTRNIVGFPPGRGSDGECLRAMLRRRFKAVPCYLYSSDESELVKLACNSFFALKVNFFNSIYNYARISAMDWDRIEVGVLSDGRIAHSHTRVPGPDGRLGFGGECLPKDLANLVGCLEEANVSAAVLRQVFHTNAMHRGPDPT